MILWHLDGIWEASYHIDSLDFKASLNSVSISHLNYLTTTLLQSVQFQFSRLLFEADEIVSG